MAFIASSPLREELTTCPILQSRNLPNRCHYPNRTGLSGTAAWQSRSRERSSWGPRQPPAAWRSPQDGHGSPRSCSAVTREGPTNGRALLRCPRTVAASFVPGHIAGGCAPLWRPSPRPGPPGTSSGYALSIRTGAPSNRSLGIGAHVQQTPFLDANGVRHHHRPRPGRPEYHRHTVRIAPSSPLPPHRYRVPVLSGQTGRRDGAMPRRITVLACTNGTCGPIRGFSPQEASGP